MYHYIREANSLLTVLIYILYMTAIFKRIKKKIRGVTTRETGVTTVTPTFSNTLTLSKTCAGEGRLCPPHRLCRT